MSSSNTTRPARVPLTNSVSISFATPPQTTRAFVLERDGNCCWLCGVGGDVLAILECAYHISAARIERVVPIFQIHGRHSPSLTHLAHANNLITLCSVCHAAYDSQLPYWCMVPTEATLERYIEHEQEDYDARVQAAEQGIRQPRSLPALGAEPVQYQALVMHPPFGRVRGLSSSQWPKLWYGEPTAVIIKAVGALLQPCQREVIATGPGKELLVGVPTSIDSDVCELVAVWSRQDPIVAKRPRKGPKTRRRKRDYVGGESGVEGAAKRGRAKTERAAGPGKGPTGTAPRRSSRIAAMRRQTVPRPSDVEECQGPSGPFVLGPESTSNQIIEQVLRWRRVDPTSL
ncbi:hypothetical protein BDZ91DRAFT_809119 [Kalaharituber pfeilii]|nr:hypothetical protein BDZ91DRAFT_809119 [Kalaharituber pfeilii]